ncbi:hypothetical protein [Gudongella sp. DL1XJH-153]|uniref:hypothetical protein n=1 Tax=Gudongella sp. DL1XJH-153 TaxID=3409804 RepID=UPI003BB4F28D
MINRYIESNREELEENANTILRGKQLKLLKEEIKDTFGTDNIVGTKVTVLGVFNFGAFLIIGMLLVESEKQDN